MKNIRKITALDTYPVRQAVLRKGKPLSTCLFDGDDLETTLHFGFFINTELTGIISLYKKNNDAFTPNNQYQIRGMAALEHHQKKGIGAALVLFCEDYCKKLLVDLIWFNARTTAVAFYEKLGYQKTGMPFEIKEVGEHNLMFKNICTE
ncbi:GNAT family N-acetyltransferase [Flavobacterium sp. ZT3R18]|uniref:GNAT family N-acetyltransferase n=1 Tax=Flavobacterium sp. ZT3R18 TaxID=2594429 RepID=UPI001179F3E0|nr:GNAT family N-acetyltransferase [Flavobacterium sp. ZT3R18]TRX38746.1 GNAT family N-acetyltransferase [Flavobacterium sp. ZT3R18]